MDREAWQATVQRATRVRYVLATKQQKHLPQETNKQKSLNK